MARTKRGSHFAGRDKQPHDRASDAPSAAETIRINLQDHELQKRIATLIRQLSHAEESKRISAINTLAEIGLSAIRPLTKALRSANPFTRGNAASALGCMGFGFYMDAPSGRLAERLSITSRALLKLLLDKDTEIRNKAAWALGEMEDTTAVPALLKMLRGNPDADVRANAARALGRIDRASFGGIIKDTTAVPRLLDALRTDQNAEVRAEAAWALKRIESVSAMPGLLQALTTDPATAVRENAASALGWIEARQPIEEVSAVTDLLDALRGDSEAKVRESAALALGFIHDVSAVPGLLEALRNDSEPVVRCEAAFALELLEDVSAVPGLLETLKLEKDIQARRAICRALGEIAASAKKVLEAIVPTLAWVGDNDPDQTVQTTAILALESARPQGRGLSRPAINRSDLAIVPSTQRRRRPKRDAAETKKNLLALLDTCLEWPDDEVVSERKLHQSEILTRNRRSLALPETVSLATVHNHLQSLARLCKVDSLLDTELKRQRSRFRATAKELLRHRRPIIEEEIARDETDRLHLRP